MLEEAKFDFVRRSKNASVDGRRAGMFARHSANLGSILWGGVYSRKHFPFGAGHLHNTATILCQISICSRTTAPQRACSKDRLTVDRSIQTEYRAATEDGTSSHDGRRLRISYYGSNPAKVHTTVETNRQEREGRRPATRTIRRRLHPKG